MSLFISIIILFLVRYSGLINHIGAESLIVNYLARVIVESTNLEGTKGVLYHMTAHLVLVDSLSSELDAQLKSSLYESCRMVYINNYNYKRLRVTTIYHPIPAGIQRGGALPLVIWTSLWC
jgi:hypothetical protein